MNCQKCGVYTTSTVHVCHTGGREHVHRFVPFPERGEFAEVRMIFCETCGETRSVAPSNAANRTTAP